MTFNRFFAAQGRKGSRAAPTTPTPLAGPGGQRISPRSVGAAGGSQGAGSSKAKRPGNSQHTNRFAAFCASWDADEQRDRVPASVRDTSYATINFDHLSARHGLRQSAVRQAIAFGDMTEGEIAAEERQAEKIAARALEVHAKLTGARR